MDSAVSGDRPGDDARVEATLQLDDLLEHCLELFLPHAPIESAERLRDFLPSGRTTELPFLLAELIKLDMAAAADAGQLPSLDRYLAALPDLLAADRLPFDLVIEEYQLRREAGHDPKQADYADRFPQHAELLARFSCNAETVAAAGKPVPPDELSPGETVDDFEIVQELGRGAFARVYLAKQLSMQRLVALKVSAGKGDEPQALAQFDHPNIVRVYDQRALHNGATHLLYMQYLPGGTLADVVKRVRWCGPTARTGQLILDALDDNLLHAAQATPEGSTLRSQLSEMPWPMAVAWLGVQLGNALDDAHRRGVLHRDVKPANVLMSAEGVPKLADFNVSMAGAAGRAGAAATLGGSIGYMAPEHLAAIGGLPGTEVSDVTEPADIYSLAVLLWEMWQGRRPFQTEGEAESWTDALAQQIVSRDLPLYEPERQETGDNSSERVLESVLREALSNDPAERPASGAELAGKLQLALHPEAATLFDPPARSWRHRALRMPAIALIASAVLLPNIAAGLFNYFYNDQQIIQQHNDPSDSIHIEGIEPAFEKLSTTVNLIAFPLGGLLAAYYGWPVARSILRAKRGEEVEEREVDQVFALCHRGAWLGGGLWGIASLVFPITLCKWYPQFPFTEAIHFCLSLLVCGGVAAVYPYFLLTTVFVAVYYPQLVRASMTDRDFDRRSDRLRRYGELYLYAAAVIPLLSIVLLASREPTAMSRAMICWSVFATLIGLFAAFRAYRYVLSMWGRMKPLLSNSRSASDQSLFDSIA